MSVSPTSLPLPPTLRRALFLSTSVLAFVLAGVTFVYLNLGLQMRAWPLVVVAGIQLALTINAGVGAELIRQQHSGWGTALVSVSVLGSLVLLAVAVTGFGPAMILITILAIPAIAEQTLPEAQANRITRMGLVAGLLTGLLTLWPVLPPTTLPQVRGVIPFLVALAFVPYIVLVIRGYRTYQLRAKLILAFVLVALIPLALLATLNERFSREALTQTANQSLAAAAKQTATTLDGFLVENETRLLTLAGLPTWASFLNLAPEARPNSPEATAVEQLIETIVKRGRPLITVQVLDARGQVVAPRAAAVAGLNARNEEYFRQPFENSAPHITPIVFSAARCHPDGSFNISVPLLAENGAPLGVLVGCYDTRLTLRDLIAQSNDLAGSESFAVLFDENHLVLAHGTAPDARLAVAGPMAPETVTRLQAAGRLPADFTAQPLSTEPVLERGLILGDQRTAFVVNIDEQPLHAAIVRLEQQPWQVAFFQSETVFLRPVQLQTSRTIILAVLIAGLMAGAALGMAQLLSNPITRLTAVALAVAQGGDLSTQARVETGDEIGALASAFNQMTARLSDMVNTLGERVLERTSQLQAVADIGRAASSTRDLSQLLPLALELIRERFGFYHASIFLLDDANQMAVLRESTGEAGRQLKARHHRLAVGSRSLVGAATAQRKPVVVQDVLNDPSHFKNPLLPDTRGEAVIPLISGDRVIGALDVQSTTPQAFGEAEVQILQTLADQLSVAIENAESFQRTQASLAEVSALYQQTVGAGWRGLTRDHSRETNYDLTPGDTTPGRHSLTLPLVLSGQIIGEIELQGLAHGTLSAEERAVLEAVSAQLAVALESAALLEETQRRSRREQLINQISYQMRTTLNPEAILQSGIRELGRALGATEVVVKMTPSGGTPPEPVLPAEVEP